MKHRIYLVTYTTDVDCQFSLGYMVISSDKRRTAERIALRSLNEKSKYNTKHNGMGSNNYFSTCYCGCVF